MVDRVLNIFYSIFIWLIFPITFAFPLVLHPSIGKILSPSSPFDIPFYGILIYIYLIGILSALILSLIFRFTIKNKILRLSILVVLIILAWLTWDPRDHTW